MKAIRKPVIVDAVRIGDLLDLRANIPQWAEMAFQDERITFAGERLYVETLEEGIMSASLNDWLVREVNGDLHTCTEDAFRKNYDLMEDGLDVR